MNKSAVLKLALGTAQFGFDYGINNKRGKIPQQEAFEILNFALQNGIDVIDTARAYDDSEKVIGQFIQENNPDFKIISKLPSDNLQNVENVFNASLKRLHLNSLYGYLIQTLNPFTEKPEIWNVLKRLQIQGKVNKIGFSLYSPEEIGYLLKKNVRMDIVQVPFNILDQRFTEIFQLLKNKRVEIHVRSVFLQGLIFKNPDNLEGKFVKIRDKLLFLRAFSKEANIPLSAVCINFALLNVFVDKVIIGIDNLKHLKENIKALNYQNGTKNIYDQLLDMKEDDENIISPINWKINGGKK